MESLKEFNNTVLYTPSSLFDKDHTKLLPRPCPGSHDIPVSHHGATPKIGSLINKLKVNKSEDNVEYLTIYNQNIWFAREDQEERFEEIVKFIEEYQPDFVCLQESIVEFYAKLKESEIIQQAYFISQNFGNWCSNINTHTVQVLSRWPVQLTELPYIGNTLMGRSLLLATTVINGVPITIANTHLESSEGFQGYDLRCKQMKTAFSALGSHSNAMIMGDFNYDAERGKEEEIRDTSFVDLFDAAPQSSTLTFTFIPRRDRLDRMLLKGPHWEPTKHYYLVGTVPIPKYEGMGIFEGRRVRSLSDHLGIISTIRFKGV